MKRTFLLFCLLASLAACSRMEPQQSGARDGEVTVNFSLGYATKATGAISDNAVNTAYVFAFDGNRLDGSATVNAATGSINVTPGSRRFIAVVNPNSEFNFTSVTTPASLMALVSQLSSESLTDMVMIGDKTETITSSSTSVAISVTRLVSKIKVNSLRFNLTGAMAGKTVYGVAVYLKNYPTTQTYAGTAGTTYSSGLYNDNHDAFEVYDLIGNLTSGSSAITDHTFFCYHRETSSSISDKNAIRLCIVGTIDGQKYYWSIPVNNGNTWNALAFQSGDSHYGVRRNHSYEYDITITRAGIPDDGSDPDPSDPDDNGDDDLEDDEDLTSSGLTFNLTVNDYIAVSEQTVTF